MESIVAEQMNMQLGSWIFAKIVPFFGICGCCQTLSKTVNRISFQIDDIMVRLIGWSLLVAICGSKLMCFHGEVQGMLNAAEVRPCRNVSCLWVACESCLRQHRPPTGQCKCCDRCVALAVAWMGLSLIIN
jgi:hypothetical protein